MRLTSLRDSLLLILLLVVAVASVSDLMDDLAHGSDVLHLAGEVAALLLAACAVAWLLRERRRQDAQLTALRAELAEAAEHVANSDAATQAQRRQLGEFINAQFATWRLTDSEREVGWLLLKGLSLKEVADLRSTLEKTVRQQASSIYQKAGVSGRHAFAAWFLEDYL
ncbi:MAG: response regulator transcription factor [Gammaproteobacteria bacterium]|nr:response regulator transcription factor [Gammaproteobacteria bacterium]